MSPSKAVGGNFGRPGSAAKPGSEKSSQQGSFTDMLLSTIDKGSKSSPAAKPDAPTPKPSSSAPKAPQIRNNEGPQSDRSSSFRDNSVRSAALYGKDPAQNTSSKTPMTSTDDGSFDVSDASTSDSNEIRSLQSQGLKNQSKQATNQSIKGASIDANASMDAQQQVAAAMMPPTNINPSGISNTTTPVMVNPQMNPDLMGMNLAGGINPADTKVALAPLKNLMSGPTSQEALLNRNAVLAFVSGRLEKLDPEALPALISDSALIKQALASGDVTKFMQTPMSIGDLANLLELDQGLINKASQAGLDPAKLVTPKDFINALGLDASRITNELQILQQKLPLEGVSSYVQRARALMASAGNKVASTTKGMTQNAALAKGNKERSDNAGKTGETKVSAEQLLPKNPTKALPEDMVANLNQPVSPQNPVVVPQSAQAMTQMPQKTSAMVTPNGATANMTNVGSVNRASVKSFDPAELLSREGFTPQLQMSSDPALRLTSEINNTVSVDRALTTESSIERPFDLSQSLNVEMMPQDNNTDPFQDFGKILDHSKTVKVEFAGDGFSQRSLEELLLAKGMENSMTGRSIANSDMISDDESKVDLTGDLATEKKDLGMDFLKEMRLNVPQDKLNLQISGNDSRFGSDEFSGQDSPKDQPSHFFGDQAKDASTSIVNATSDARKSSDVFTNKLDENAPGSGPKESVAAKILGQAQMMFKNGGGSMRVDMEAPGIGKVDVAINLINNQLDVRIITATEQARDMISKEVAGLRDGLNQQGISLRGLEVGKAGESTPRHFSGNGQQFGQGASQQKASYNEMREYAQNFKNSQAPRIDRSASMAAPSLSRWSNGAVPSIANGRVEVRV